MKFSEYREQKTHGTKSFPLEYYFVDENHPQYVMPLHWHSEFEVLRVNRGRLAVYLNNEVYDLGEGDVIFIPSGTLHRGEPKDCAGIVSLLCSDEGRYITGQSIYVDGGKSIQ